MVSGLYPPTPRAPSTHAVLLEVLPAQYLHGSLLGKAQCPGDVQAVRDLLLTLPFSLFLKESYPLHLESRRSELESILFCLLLKKERGLREREGERKDYFS